MSKIIATHGNETVVGSLWEKNGKRRIYISGEFGKVDSSVRRAASRGNDYGYVDVVSGEYIPGKLDVERRHGSLDIQAVIALF